MSIAFIAIEGFKELSAISLDLSRDMLLLYNACVRETLSTCGG